MIIDLDAKGPPIAKRPVEGIIALRVFDRTHRHVVHVFRADTRRLSIGRGSESELVVEAEGVARIHARVAVRDGTYVISDTGTANGTFVNGARVDERQLAVGDIITLHQREVEVVTLDDGPCEREQTFLDALDDDAMRAVYADWLEEQGRHAGAEMAKGRIAYPRPPDSEPPK